MAAAFVCYSYFNAGFYINGRHRPLRSLIQHGDQVEIITSGKQTINKDWLDYSVTGKARSHIERFVRQQNRQEMITLGHRLLNADLSQLGKPFVLEMLTPLAKQYKYDSREDILFALGNGEISREWIISSLYPTVPKNILSKETNLNKPTQDAKISNASEQHADKQQSDSLLIEGLTSGVALHYAECCTPIPGDKIRGIRMMGQGIKIHRDTCPKLDNFASMEDRHVRVKWNQEKGRKGEFYNARIKIIMLNKPGALALVCAAVAKRNININDMSFFKKAADYYEILISVGVIDTRNMDAILRDLPAINSVASAVRL